MSLHNSLPQHTYSIIDCTAASCTGTLAGEIAIMSNFIPCTDHHPVFSRLILTSPVGLADAPNIPLQTPASLYSPCFCVPFQNEKYHLSQFSSSVDQKLTQQMDTFSIEISSDDAFQNCYHSFTDILISSAKSSFQLPQSCKQSLKVTNPTIRLLVTELIGPLNPPWPSPRSLGCTTISLLSINSTLIHQTSTPISNSSFHNFVAKSIESVSQKSDMKG